MALTNDGLRAVKRALVSRFPDAKSSYLSEALAAACGFRTHASLLASLREGESNNPDFILLDDTAFKARHCELTGISVFDPQGAIFDTLPIAPGSHLLKTISSKFHQIDYSKSTRRRAWRNAMVAGINAGLSRRLFSLRPGDNRWPGAERDPPAQQKAYVFGFEIAGIPAAASLWDAGWDEISVHVALWPTENGKRWVDVANAGFHAGDLFASGWLERRNGAWLQVASDSGKGWNFRCRNNRLSEAAALQIRPAGFADHGTFAL